MSNNIDYEQVMRDKLSNKPVMEALFILNKELKKLREHIPPLRSSFYISIMYDITVCKVLLKELNDTGKINKSS